MSEEFTRTALLLGGDAMEKLSKAKVAVFGLGGVGGYVAETLARSGVGHLALIDGDTVSVTNINRQIYALHSTIGRYKADVAKERVLQINPHICADERKIYYDKDTENQFDLASYDYVADAIDTVTSKVMLAVNCQAVGTPLISCLGTGNKLDPTALKITDIYKTSVCPLARVMRRELKKRGVEKLTVVYSEEEPKTSPLGRTPCSTAFVPPVAGILMASRIIEDLIR